MDSFTRDQLLFAPSKAQWDNSPIDSNPYLYSTRPAVVFFAARCISNHLRGKAMLASTSPSLFLLCFLTYHPFKLLVYLSPPSHYPDRLFKTFAYPIFRSWIPHCLDTRRLRSWIFHSLVQIQPAHESGAYARPIDDGEDEQVWVILGICWMLSCIW